MAADRLAKRAGFGPQVVSLKDIVTRRARPCACAVVSTITIRRVAGMLICESKAPERQR